MDLSSPIRGLPIAVVDFETSGIDAWTCDPLQVAVYHTEIGSRHDPALALQSLIRASAPIPAEATFVHGITDEMVADAPTMSDVGGRLAAACEGRIVCAFNLPYDWAILRRCILAAGPLPIPAFPGLDPIVWHRTLSGRWKGKLSEVAPAYGITLDGAHDAAADAGATARLILPMLREMHAREMLGRYELPGDVPLGRLLDLQTEWALSIQADMERFFSRKGQAFQRSWSMCADAMATSPAP